MSPTDFLIRIDPYGVVILAITAWISFDVIRSWRYSGCSNALHLEIGIALWGAVIGAVMVLSAVRRELWLDNQEMWWFVESWPYVSIKVAAILGTVEIVRGLTQERYGRAPWLISAGIGIVLLLIPYIGQFVSDIIFNLFEFMRLA